MRQAKPRSSRPPASRQACRGRPGDRFADDGIGADSSWGQLLGVNQDLDALLAGLPLGDKGTAELNPEEGLRARGQQFRVHRLGGLKGGAMLAELKGQ